MPVMHTTNKAANTHPPYPTSQPQLKPHLISNIQASPQDFIMATTETICRIRLYDGTQLLDLKDHTHTTPELRQQWATSILTHFRTPANEPHTRLRTWDLLAHLDGSVQCLPAPLPTPTPDAVSSASGTLGSVYPIRYRLPPSILPSGPLTTEELVIRAEIFALRSLLYEVLVGRKPFEDLPDDEVQRRFAAGEFPADADAMNVQVVLPSGAPSEAEGGGPSSQTIVVKKDGGNSLLHTASAYARAHPLLVGVQAAGLVLTTAAFCVNPVLGAVGFTAAGPAAGSAAAAWQASMGAVQAGSLFAWCQSAAMGGTAVGGIQAVGLAGTALTAVPRVVERVRAGLGIGAGREGQRMLGGG